MEKKKKKKAGITQGRPRRFLPPITPHKERCKYISEGSAFLQSMDFQREPQSKHHLYFLDFVCVSGSVLYLVRTQSKK